jgi:hypothetical protein
MLTLYCHCSLTEDISKKELINIFHNIENTVERIERKKNPKPIINKKRKLIPHEKPDAEELNALASWEIIKKDSVWRKVIESNLSLEERDPVFHAGNVLFHDRVVIVSSLCINCFSATVTSFCSILICTMT